MLIVKNEIKDFKYNKLVLYALLRCDAFTFALPDMDSKSGFDSRSNEFSEYKKEVEYRLEAFEPYILNKYIDKNYFSSERGYYSEIYVVSLNEDSVGTIMATEGLFSWKYPEMPEDLYFFSKGVCWLESVAHEKTCLIYTDHDVEKEILKKVIGLKFYEDDNMNSPVLDLDNH